MKKKILTIGCSFTKDNYQLTWADYLANNLDMNLDNIAARGAGIDFLSKRLMYHISQNPCDLLIIMLPSADRFDWYVDKHHPLIKDAVKISSWQNGLFPSLVRLDGSPSNQSGFCLSGGEIRGEKKYWYKYYYNPSSVIMSYWKTVLDIQIFLDSRKVKYFITMAYDKNSLIEQNINQIDDDKQYQFFYDQINWKKFIFYGEDQGFLSYVRDNKFQIKNHHPVTESHKAWTENILLPSL